MALKCHMIFHHGQYASLVLFNDLGMSRNALVLFPFRRRAEGGEKAETLLAGGNT